MPGCRRYKCTGSQDHPAQLSWFLRAPDLRHAAEQPRPLTTGQDTATNRLSFSSDVYRIGNTTYLGLIHVNYTMKYTS